MTTDAAAPAVRIRVPLFARIVAGVMAIGAPVVIGIQVIRGFNSGPTLWLIWPVAFLALWETVVVRTALVGVSSTSDGRLIVRNQFRTHTFERTQVEEVRRSAGGMFSPNQGAVQLLLADGSVLGLQATARPPFGGPRVEEQLESLRRWLAG
jgi:hypothetical protein